MPSRVALPKLKLFSSRHSSSPSMTGSKMPQPTTQRDSQVSPPARLHLRNILPASPEEPPIMPPPPRTPGAWVWRCHECHRLYRLSCTRRCFNCWHTCCVGKYQSSDPDKVCVASFDWDGWEQWGSWKRKVLGHESAGRCDVAARDRAFLAKRHNCWIDCDSPSECGHRRKTLAARMLRRRMFASSDESDAEESPAIVADASPKSPDDDVSLHEALARSEAADDGKSPQKSPLQASFTFDDDVDNEEEEDETWWTVWSRGEQSDDDDNDSTANNINEDSDPDSGSESGESEWSSVTSLTDYSSLAETGTAIKEFC